MSPIPHRDGDVVVYHGQCRGWPPREIAMCNLYNLIHEYQRSRYGWSSDWRATHAEVVTSNELLDLTIPRAILKPFPESFHVPVRVYRYKHARLNDERMRKRALAIEGTPYDVGDLADFAVQGLVAKLFGFWIPYTRVFGDAKRSFETCAVAAGDVTFAGGAHYKQPISSLVPAYWSIHPEDWTLIYRSDKTQAAGGESWIQQLLSKAREV